MWGVEFSPGNKTLHHRMVICRRNNAKGFVPNDYNIVACFERRKDAEQTYGELRMLGHKSRVVTIDVWAKNLERTDGFWYEKDEGSTQSDSK